MKSLIKITESQFERLINNIIEREKYSEEELKYTNPENGLECFIRVAKKKFSNDKNYQYGAVLVCDEYGDGKLSIIAEIPVNESSPEKVKNRICNNIEKVYEILDGMFMMDGEEFLEEDIEFDRWVVLDEPIFCDII